MKLTNKLYLTSVVTLFSSTTLALDCSENNGYVCVGNSHQFSSSFLSNSQNLYGGFGGGECVSEKTPIIFLHGNGDNSISWDIPPRIAPHDYPLPSLSVYDYFRAKGYNDCELFGLTYLSKSQQESPQYNYHDLSKQEAIANFIRDVRSYTGSDKVSIVAHSMGVSLAIASLTKHKLWDNVETFINISGALRGLQSCRGVGYANPLAPTCGSQNIYNYDVFGFYPDNGAFYSFWGRNDFTGKNNPRSLREAPLQNPQTYFYTITAGEHDQVHCSSHSFQSNCQLGALFTPAKNVLAQLNIGSGDKPTKIDFNFSDFSPYNLLGGDKNGVGHFNSKTNSASIIYSMIVEKCKNLECAQYYHYGPVTL